MSQKNDERNGKLNRLMEGISIRAIEGSERKYHISFSSEEPYERWWGTEILSHADGAVDLERLNSIGVVLFNHNPNNPIGKVEKAWIENGRGEADIEFDDDDFLSYVREKVASGTLKGVSVGYVVDAWEEVAANKQSGDGRFTGPCDIATRWTPYEVSIVSVPADPTVGVGRSHETEVEAPQKPSGVSCSYYNEKQLQINLNTVRR